MNVAAQAIVLSDDDDSVDFVDLDSDDDGILEGYEEGWSCAHCTTSNSGLSGDCSVCGLPRVPILDPLATGAIVDLSEATEAYVRTTSSRASESSITLDGCGCTVDQNKFRAHVSTLAGSLPVDSGALEIHFHCPETACGRALTRRDIISMIGTSRTAQVDQHIYSAFWRQLGEPKADQHLNSSAAKQALKLAAAVQSLSESMGMAVQPGNGAESAQRQAGCSNQGGSCKPAKSGPAMANNKRKGVGASGTALPAHKAAKPTKALGKSQAAPKAGGKAQGGAAQAQGFSGVSHWVAGLVSGTEAVVEAISGKPQGNAKGLAKGTGYGGDDRYNDVYHRSKKPQRAGPSKDEQKAKERESEADTKTLEALTEIQCHIDAASGGPGLLQGCNMLICAVAFGSPLAFLLRRLLQNDSLMDIGHRSSLYWGVVRLAQSLGRSVDFVPLFLKPAADPNDSDEGDADSMLDAMKKLDTQCKVFKRNAEDLTSEEEIRALSLALEISSHCDELKKAAEVLSSAQKRGRAALSPDALGPASRVEDREKAYCKAVGEFKLGQWPLVALKDFYFRKEADAGQGFAGRKSLLRIGQEMSSLSTSLPTALATSVFLVTDESRMDILRACIIGPEGTPYENGIFLFDILLPPEYPEKPPKVQFLTTGGGKVRFNPNLYDCGKVCLSLLGTWSGPSWDPGTSTLLQVLVSIQSMIFIDDPYFNEPGYERSAGTSSGAEYSQKYNANIRQQTLKHALLPALLKPPPSFKEVLQIHFKLKFEAIQTQLTAWHQLDPSIYPIVVKVRDALGQYKPGK